MRSGVARVHTVLSATQTFIHEWMEWTSLPLLRKHFNAFTRWRHPSEVAHIRLQLEHYSLIVFEKSPAQTPYRRKFVSVRQAKKMQFSCFRALPGSVEALVRWSVIWLLAFLATFLPKILKSVDAGRSYSKPKQCRFL